MGRLQRQGQEDRVSATLTGILFDGSELEGTDSICIVPERVPAHREAPPSAGFSLAADFRLWPFSALKIMRFQQNQTTANGRSGRSEIGFRFLGPGRLLHHE